MSKKPLHPGQFVKEQILTPRKITVTKAAELLEVSRPALSNFLNGKAGLSVEMAGKICAGLGVNETQLRRIRDEHDDWKRRKEGSGSPVKSYAPSFLKITATNIEEWADKIEARNLLPVLIRKLVNTTDAEIIESDFPAYDDSQKHGWDGYTQASSVTPWLLLGKTGWEFGCNKSIKGKADDDFQARTESDEISDEERKDTSFIFITPRNWNGKDKWMEQARAEGKWKDVRAYDALDLEQWLETSIPSQIWLAEQFGIPADGAFTSSRYWQRWSGSCDPDISDHISPKIFSSAIVDYSDEITRWYRAEPGKHLIISSTSKEEALAFVSAIPLILDDTNSELHKLSDRVVFLNTPEQVRKFSELSKNIIPVAAKQDAQEEIATAFAKRHAIIVIDRGTNAVEPNITIGLPSASCFREALQEMGIEHEEIEKLARKSGYSPTILRRLISSNPAIKTPKWSQSDENKKRLLPLVLAGAWDSRKDADRQILELLSDSDYKDVEKDIAALAKIDDAPVWREGSHRGVVSKIDCLYAISDFVTESEIENFITAALLVLSEEDPALELPEKDRWAAGIYNKVRGHSDAIRSNISENLIILAVHGDGLFGRSLGIGVSSKVNWAIRQLLGDIKPELWMSQRRILPSYAEAAPQEFLDIVETEIGKKNPAFAPLFESAEDGFFSDCNRSGMLWALETLAWNPANLMRVIGILGEFSTYELDDKWSNKPIGSLQDILLIWKPHTAADVNARCAALEMLCNSYPEIGWGLCIDPLKSGSSYTSGTHQPLWRNDASGTGQPMTHRTARVYSKKCIDLIINWGLYDTGKLKDLLQCLHVFTDEQQDKIFQIYRRWLEGSPENDDVLDLREYVRTHALTTRARKIRKEDDCHVVIGKKLYDLLEPKDLFSKCFWLFEKSWVDLTQDEIEASEFDFDAKDKEVERLRIRALSEIYSDSGTQGIIDMILKGNACSVIGRLVRTNLLTYSQLTQFIIECLNRKDETLGKVDQAISGILFKLEKKAFQKLSREILAEFRPQKKNTSKISRFLMNASFDSTTWDVLSKLGKTIQAEYWNLVYPDCRDLDKSETDHAVTKLIEADRPQVALQFVHYKLDNVSTALLIELLEKLASSNSEGNKQPIKVDQNDIEEAFNSLNKRNEIDRSRLARLEYIYSDVLDQFSSYGIPNLSNEIAGSPAQFMQLNCLSFKRDDGNVDPPDWRGSSDDETRKSAARKAYQVLQNVNVIPGTEKDENIDRKKLLKWIADVRVLAKELARDAITDQQIGKLLSQSREEGKDDIWPREEIRDVFEEVASREISIGLEIGFRNARGATVRWMGEKATEERNLAKKYRDMAKRLEISKPFTAGMLNRIAESYDHDAESWESDHRVRQRLRG